MIARARIARELTIAGVMLIIGLLAVPIAVYFVGQTVVGPYEGDGGLFSLLGQVWTELLDLRVSAWILVSSPYAIVLLLRAAVSRRPHRRIDVTDVTDSE